MVKRSDIFTLIVSLCLILAICFYGVLHPSQHFIRQPIPVIPIPDKLPTESGLMQNNRFNILLLGIDAREQEISRTDAILIINVNPLQNVIRIVSIPRDTRIEIPGVGFTKINHAHSLGEKKAGNHGGTMAAVEAVSTLFDCGINYYVKINFAGFSHFIDTIGGLDLEIKKPVWLTYAKIMIPEGQQHLDGFLTLKLVRERYSLAEGDIMRQKHQYDVLLAIARKILTPEYIKKLPDLIEQMQKDVVDTNLSKSDILSLAWALQDLKEKEAEYIKIPGKRGYYMDPLVGKKLYYWIPDNKELEEIAQKYLR